MRASVLQETLIELELEPRPTLPKKYRTLNSDVTCRGVSDKRVVVLCTGKRTLQVVDLFLMLEGATLPKVLGVESNDWNG